MTSRSIWTEKSLVPHASTVPTTWSAGKLAQADAGAETVTDADAVDEQDKRIETSALVGWNELCKY
jgi:hypothetical protein